MKKINAMSDEKFLRLLFFLFGAVFLIAAVCMPDRADMFKGLWRIVSQTAKTPTNYFDPSYGGYAGAFLNVACVTLICSALYLLPGSGPGAASVIAVLLTAGLAFWGINLLNVWFGFFGVALYCLVKKKPLGAYADAMIFTTGMAPLFSDLILAYPNALPIGFRWHGLLLALLIGLFVGFFLPAGMAYAPRIHKNYTLFSAAVPIGMTAFFLRAFLYHVLGAARGTTAVGPTADLGFASWQISNFFCLAFFALCIVFALVLGCKPKDYLALLKDSGYETDFLPRYGKAVGMMNAGVFGLFILLYYNLTALIGGSHAIFNAVTLGCIFCMLSTCSAGSHPRNVWPVMVGYIGASFLFGWVSKGFIGGEYLHAIDAQAMLVGLCFASGLSPLIGKFGWQYGILAGVVHFVLVTSVPLLHGGFCLYNGGFTAAFTCILLVPILEHFNIKRSC